MLIVTSSRSKAIAFIYQIFKTQKVSQDKKKAKLSLLFILKFKSDTNILLFNKIEVLQKGVQRVTLAQREIVLTLWNTRDPSACLLDCGQKQ